VTGRRVLSELSGTLAHMNKPTTLLAAAACIGALAMPAAAEARSSYCSASGDICYGVTTSGGKVKLQVTLQANYFLDYKLCVTPPTGKRTCITDKVKKAKHGSWAATVTWNSKFPDAGKGTYKAKWYAGQSLGPAVTFKR
jgi:hypothetical protein